jgi:hypothetical protein
MAFFTNLLLVLSDFIPNETPKMIIEISTIIPPGATFSTYDDNIPATAENTAKHIESIAVCLKPFENKIAVTLGTTIRDEVSNIPTSCIELTTAIAAITTKR